MNGGVRRATWFGRAVNCWTPCHAIVSARHLLPSACLPLPVFFCKPPLVAACSATSPSTQTPLSCIYSPVRLHLSVPPSTPACLPFCRDRLLPTFSAFPPFSPLPCIPFLPFLRLSSHFLAPHAWPSHGTHLSSLHHLLMAGAAEQAGLVHASCTLSLPLLHTPVATGGGGDRCRFMVAGFMRERTAGMRAAGGAGKRRDAERRDARLRRAAARLRQHLTQGGGAGGRAGAASGLARWACGVPFCLRWAARGRGCSAGRYRHGCFSAYGGCLRKAGNFGALTRRNRAARLIWLAQAGAGGERGRGLRPPGVPATCLTCTLSTAGATLRCRRRAWRCARLRSSLSPGVCAQLAFSSQKHGISCSRHVCDGGRRLACATNSLLPC